MRIITLVAFVVLTILAETAIGGNASGKYNVYRSTTSGVCKVQEETERPLMGDKFLYPFNSRAAAKAAMCKNYKTGLGKKCDEVLPRNACG